MPIKMTKLQKEYIKDIEKILQIKYCGLNCRRTASKFIKEHKKQHSFEKAKQGKSGVPLPTGNQLRYIKQIEKVLEVSFKGKTYREADSFIGEYKPYYQLQRTNVT